MRKNNVDIDELLQQLEDSINSSKSQREEAARKEEELGKAAQSMRMAKKLSDEGNAKLDEAEQIVSSIGVEFDGKSSKNGKKDKKNNKGSNQSFYNARRYIAGFMAGVVTLTGGHFIGSSISRAVKSDNNSVSVSTELNKNDVIDNELLTFLKGKKLLDDKQVNKELTNEEVSKLVVEFKKQLDTNADKYYNKGLYREVVEIDRFLELDDNNQLNYVINSLRELGLINNYSFNYDGSAVITTDENYVELTTEEFENLVSLRIKEFEELKLNLSREDVIKYAMIVNCDKLSQDNKDLVSLIVGEQEADEIQQDAYKVTGAVVMYNYNIWYKEGKTDNFIRLSNFIFDEEARNKAATIEKRVDEIALSVNDKDKMNELVHALLLDLTNPESELSYLESGVTFAVQTVLEPVRGLFGMDLYGNITLNETNAELIKYFVPYAGDDQVYMDNNMLTGALQDIHNILADCPNHTLSK